MLTAARKGLWRALAAVAVVLTPLVLLWPERNAGFVSDDIFFALLWVPPPWQDLLLGPWPHGMGATAAWRPLALISWVVSGAWLPWMEPAAAHRVLNYLLHGLNGWALCLIAGRVTGSRRASIWTAALFLVHPIVHESVMWISGRTFLLAAFFGQLLLVWTFDRRLARGWLQHGIGVLLLVLSLASYEFAVVLPLLVFAVVLLRPGTDPVAARAWQALRFSAPYWIVLAAYLAFRWTWLTNPAADVLVLARASQWAPVDGISYRLPRNAFFALLRLFAWPWFPRGSEIAVGATGLFTTAVVLASAAWLWWSRRRRVLLWWFAFGAVWFLPAAAASAFTDRFGYMGAAAVAGIVGAAMTSSSARTPSRYAWLAVGACLASLWVSALRHHAREWTEAGVLAERLVAQALVVEPGPAEPTDLHFVNVPRRHGAALVFLTYFPNAVFAKYGDNARANVAFFLYWEPWFDVAEKVTRQGRGRAIRIHEWDPASATFVRRFERPAS